MISKVTSTAVQSRKTHLSTHAIWWWPRKIVLLHDLRVDDDPLQLLHHGLVDEGLLADHGVVLVVGIVGVPQLAVRQLDALGWDVDDLFRPPPRLFPLPYELYW